MKCKRTILIILFTSMVGFFIFLKKADIINSYFSVAKLQFLIKGLNDNYLYEIDEEAGEEGIYSGYVAALENSGTCYLNGEELKVAQIEMQGDTFSTGLSLMWSADQNYLIVIGVEENSPASREGIEVGDCIVKVDEIQAIAANSQEIVQLLFSVKKEAHLYELARGDKSFEVTLMPERIDLKEFSTEVIDDVIYMKLNTIKAGTSQNIKEALDKIDGTNYKGMILDTRDLSTQNIDEVYQISDLFLEDEIAFKIESKKKGLVTYHTNEGAYKTSLVVLCNQGTSAGAEALVMALKEHAKILGSSTEGNPYIKQIVAFKDGTGISVACGEISNRYGEKLSKEGVMPDIKLYISEEEKQSLLERGYITKEQDSYLQAALAQFK